MKMNFQISSHSVTQLDFTTDDIGEGMVEDGTKCGSGKVRLESLHKMIFKNILTTKDIMRCKVILVT